MRVLQEQWKQMPPPALVGREDDLRALLAAARRPGGIVELVAQPGMGKTSLLKALATFNDGAFSGTIEYFSGSPDFPLTDAVEAIAERLRAAGGNSLLIIDGADLLDPAQTLEAINRLSTGPWTFSTVVASHTRLGLGEAIQLGPLGDVSFRDLLRQFFDSELDAASLDRLWSATRGNPAVARLLADHWRAGRVPDLVALTALLEPWRVSGLIGLNGEPLRSGSAAEQRIITDVREVSDALLRQIANDLNLVFSMPSRRFEELVAELLERHGYQVTLTPQTRDGGKDMYAAMHDAFGSFLYIVECKRQAPDRPVGVGVVRALHGVAQHERVNAANALRSSPSVPAVVRRTPLLDRAKTATPRRSSIWRMRRLSDDCLTPSASAARRKLP